MIVVIPCGARKLDRRAQAQHMYVGSYAQMCQRYARTLTTPDRIFILSAKYGLLRLTDEIEPYSLTLGQPGCVSQVQVWNQAKELGIVNEPCVAIGGMRYTNLCKKVWRVCQTPLQDHVRGGNGKQLQWMKERINP